MRIATFVTWLIGAGLLAGLLVMNDAGKLFAAAWQLRGWLVVIALYHGVPLLFDVLGWRRLFERPPDFASLLRIRWMGEGVNGLLPVPHLGEVLRAKLPHDEGSDLTDAATSVVGDVTIGLATQIIFIATGLAYFSLRSRHDVLLRSALTIAALVLFGLQFYWAQRTRWFSRAAGAVGRFMGRARSLDGSWIRTVEDALHRLYGHRRAVAIAFVWRLLSWFAGAGEIWLVPYLLGHPISIGDAVTLESLSQGARAAAFIIPGGLGVQDGTLMVLSQQLGLGGELGLVISLVKRFRELALGIPAVALAYSGELRRWRRIAAQAGSTRLSMPAMLGIMRGRSSRES
ncbi:MAG TPA: flippase-like domain-containing protein [Stellaceae bacterium]|nr:flippase-like domain-containing protein [Stellaceae bacterium]